MFQLHLKSRVGRRLFLSFLIATLVPMSGLAWYAYDQVSELLLETGYRRIQEDSKAFGMSIVQELNRRTDELKHVSVHVSAKAETQNHSHDGFRSVSSHPIPALNNEQRQHLERGNVVLHIGQNGDGRMIAPIQRNSHMLVGELDMGSLLHNDNSPENYCVVSTTYEPLFCTPDLVPPGKADLPSLIGPGNTGGFSWKTGSGDYLGAFWRARLMAAFASPGFIVLVATPRSLAMRSLERFQHIFPAIVLLSLALAAWLAITQIRRQMNPLGLLAAGTRRLAAGDLSTRVAVTGGDEFASLGKSFNGMASNLDYKFHMIRMLAELDRAILSASEMDYVIQAVLGHIRQAIPCDSAGLMRLDDHGGSLLIAHPTESAFQSSSLQCAGITDLPGIDLEQPWSSIRLGKDMPDCMRNFSDRHLEQLIVFPVQVNERVDSLLLLGYAQAPENMDEIVQSGRSLADRLAIASSSIAWEEKLYHQAHYDALTDLPNRVLLRDRVEQAIMRATREATSVGMMLIDLDNFKQINDSLGHTTGDKLLVECARRLKTCVRGSDTVARLGGDEFVLLVTDLVKGEESGTLDSMARTLNEALAQPVMLGDQSVISQASIGIAVYPENAAEFESLLKMADAAMYESKRQQSGSFCFYSRELNIQTRNRFELKQELREAIARQELVLYYQPKVEAATGRIAGAEALVRWNSPKRGLISPSLFLHLLGEMGLDVWLGEWVLDTACVQMKEWNRQGLAGIPVSINMSPTQFERSPVVDRVRLALEKHGLPASQLEIEILEDTAVSDHVEVRDTLVRLRELGVGIALDDFGTGYSSLVYLTRIPANVLKLDRAFIKTMAVDERQKDIVEHIIALAKVMEFKIVAEGVESEDQYRLLTEMQCDLIQGYYVSEPVPADHFAARWLGGKSRMQPISRTA